MTTENIGRYNYFMMNNVLYVVCSILNKELDYLTLYQLTHDILGISRNQTIFILTRPC